MSKARCTAVERDQRVQEAARLLSEGQTVRSIIRQFRAEYGLSTRQVRNFISCATQQIRQDMAVDRMVMVAQAVKVYQRLIDDPDTRPRDVIRARTRLDNLFGLDSPQRLQIEASDRLEVQQAISEMDFGAI